MVKQYLLFDLDRTLWDFDGNAERTYCAMFDEFGLEKYCHVDFHTFHNKYRIINDALWDAYRNGTLCKELLAIQRFSLTLAAFGCNAESSEIIRLSRKMSDYYIINSTHQRSLMPGTQELLQWLKLRHDRFVLAVITNGFSETQMPKMKTAGLYQYFDFFFLSEDLGFMKPDRRFFDVAMQRMGVTPEQCLVIGDDYKVDVEGAKGVGIQQVWYNPQTLALPAGCLPPTYEIRHLMELKELLATKEREM